MTALHLSLVVAGYVLGRAQLFRRWRISSERRLRSGSWEDAPHWTWVLLAIELAITHPVRSWRAARPEFPSRKRRPSGD